MDGWLKQWMNNVTKWTDDSSIDGQITIVFIIGELAYIEAYTCPKVQYIVTTSSINVGQATTINTGTWNSLVHGIGSYRKLEALRKSNPVSRPELPDVQMPERGRFFHSDVAHGWCVPSTESDLHCVSCFIVHSFIYSHLSIHQMLSSAQYRNEKENQPMVRDSGIITLTHLSTQLKVSIYSNLGSFLRAMCVVLVLFFIIIPLALTNFGAKLLIKVQSHPHTSV